MDFLADKVKNRQHVIPTMVDSTVQLDKFALHAKLMSMGVSDLDAKILLDCVIAKKSCSWVNTDEVGEAVVANLNKFMLENSHPLVVKVEPVPRSKYIWEVKAIRK